MRTVSELINDTQEPVREVRHTGIRLNNAWGMAHCVLMAPQQHPYLNFPCLAFPCFFIFNSTLQLFDTSSTEKQLMMGRLNVEVNFGFA